MSKALKLVLTYFVTFLIFLFIGTFIYTLYMDVQGFIAGQKLNFFDVDQIVKAAFTVAYALCFLIGPYLCCYRIRHPYGVAQTVAFILLFVLTWAAVFPGISYLETFCYDKIPSENTISHLSGGYFRKNENHVYYFTRDFYSHPYENDDTNTVVIDTSGNGTVEFKKIQDDPSFELYGAAEPYNEVQVKENFKSNNLKVKMDIRLLIDVALEAWNTSWINYLGFVSIGLVLASLYAMTYFFGWKLLNTCFIFLSTVLIFCINTFVYTPEAEKILASVESVRFVNFLKKFFDNPSIVLLNVIVAIIFIVAGLVKKGIVNHKKKAAE